jgi:hypothetical protein
MSEFEFVFTLFGLVLGLALAEIFGGLRTAIQSRRKIRIGVLTPLLGLIVAFDLVSFWLAFWYVGEAIPANSISMIGGLVITGVYYLVAGLVFPGDPAEWPDYDSYFFGHKQLVFGGIVLCNALGMAGQSATGAYDPFATLFSTFATLSFFALMILAIWLPGRRANVALLAFIAAMYPVFSIADLLVSRAAT